MSMKILSNNSPIIRVNTPGIGIVGSIVDLTKEGTFYFGRGCKPSGMIISVDTGGWNVLTGTFEIQSYNYCIHQANSQGGLFLEYHVHDSLYVYPLSNCSKVSNSLFTGASYKVLGTVLASNSNGDITARFEFGDDLKLNEFKKTNGPQRCIKCLTDYPYAEESNQPDGTFKCWGCRNF